MLQEIIKGNRSTYKVEKLDYIKKHLEVIKNQEQQEIRQNDVAHKTEEIYIPIKWEFFLSRLYGKHYYGFTGFHRKSNWKRELSKLIKTIKKTVTQNIDSDAYHEELLEQLFIRADQALKDNDESIRSLNMCMIMYLTEILFTLLGHFPDNEDRKSTNKKDHWDMNKYRSLIYVQNKAQKANLIFYLALFGFIQKPICVSIFNKLSTDLNFNRDKEKFLKWFKENHQDIYLKIFEGISK